MLDFDELRIRARTVGPDRYLVVANGPTQDAALVNIADQPRRLRASLERAAQDASGDDARSWAREIGLDVSALLFGPSTLGPVLSDAHSHSLSQSGRGSLPQRGLRVRFDLPPELSDLPVEALTAGDQSIALAGDRSVARTGHGGPSRFRLPGATDRPDRINLLIAVAAPTNLPDTRPDAAIKALDESTDELTIRTTVIRHATQSRIDEWLDDPADVPAAVLLIAHARNDDSGGGVVLLEGEDGAALPVSGRALAGQLSRDRRLRLVILALYGEGRPPVDDLALTLLAEGIPAVIGMPARPGDDWPGSFWVQVIRGICANRTLDEAVMSARVRVHGGAGWAMPRLFLHEDCGQSWLYKAREVRDDPSSYPDPLSDGAQALEKVDAERGTVGTPDLIAAARYVRSQRDWQRVVRKIRRHKRSPEEEALAAEARLEIAWPAVEKLCAHLAAGRAAQAEAAWRELSSAADQLPADLHALLNAEVTNAVCYARGRGAETAALWRDAAEAYESCRTYRDAATRARYVQGELAAAGEDWTTARTFFETLPTGEWDARSLAVRVAAGLRGLAERAGMSGDWDGAARLYAQLRPDEDNVDGLVGYAHARAAEAEGRWAEAAQLYAALPSGVADVPDRRRYADGCMHAAAGEWDLVVEGFGPLPDSYDHGKVGVLRRVARARVAGNRGDWREALSHLESLADDEADGEAGIVRHLAYGRLREDDGDWAGAASAYVKVAAASDEAAHAHQYALGRVSEQNGDWAAALDRYAAVPPGYTDAASRRAYAAARLAEDNDVPDWGAVLEAYLAVTVGFLDVADRIWYARLRVAVEAGQWERAIEAAKELDDRRDGDSLADYARGRLAAEQDDWPATIAFLERARVGLTGLLLADAGHWLAYAQGRQRESVGNLQDAVESYAMAGPAADAGDRRTWLSDLLRLWPWAGEGPLIPDPLADQDPAFPYTALRPAGITPGSSAESVNDVSYTLMEQGGMTWRQRVAWDELRIPARRLLTDALLHRMRDPERLATVLSSGGAAHRDGADGPQDPPQSGLPVTRALLSAQMGEDGPLMALLTGDREGAVRGWRERLAALPGDLLTVHCLAVADYWQARALEETGAWEQAVPVWREALACWAVLLTDSGYWTGWRQSRAASYDHAVTPAATARLRIELAEHLAQELSRYAERHADAGRPEQARRYRQLSYLLEADLDAARTLDEAGGLRLPASLDTAPTSVPQIRLACGPGYLTLGRLARPLAALVLDLAHRQRANDPEAGGEQLRRLRSAFSHLSTAFSHAEHHRFEQALRELTPGRLPWLADLPPDCPDVGPHLAEGGTECTECRDFLEHNPGYALLPHRAARLLQDTVLLAVRSYLCIARDLLPVRPEDALAAMRDAIAVAEKAAIAVHAKEAVLRMILGRVEALADGTKPRLPRLEEALHLVTWALSELGAFQRDKLTLRQAELIAERGIWYRLSCRDEGIDPDLERSLADLRLALALSPSSYTARAHLARGLLFGTGGLPGSPPADILAGLRLLSAGLARAPRGYAKDWRLALDELQPLLLSDLSIEQLGKVASEYNDDDSAGFEPRQRAQYLHAQALRRLEASDLLGAVLTLSLASRTDPAAEEVRRDLLDALRRHFGLDATPGDEPPADDTMEGGQP